MKKLWNEFKTFAFKGNVLDMAVGVIIGGAFGAIVTSLINDLIMPLIGLLIKADFSKWFVALDGNTYASLEAANEAGAAVLNYGSFISAIVYFLLVALCIFLVVKGVATARKKMEDLKKKEEPAPEPAKQPRLCPYCYGEIHDEATRCPHCTSELPKEE
ncbi:MAG: large conductance mechanosensitive channel protein MscL [Clostridia bacterium]|nr:large conductance mechanosensitive channel protein MscL [Clostridia bacterium]